MIVIANKLDDPRRTARVEFHRLGLGEPIPLSAPHGHHTGDLLDRSSPGSRPDRRARRRRGDPRCDPRPPERRQVDARQRAARQRTRDRLGDPGHDARRDRHGARARRDVLLVDTAGLRRKRQQRQGIEYYSELRALEAAERADVALVLIDASEGDCRAGRRGGGHGPQGATARRSSCSPSGTSSTVAVEATWHPRSAAGSVSAPRSSPSRCQTGRGVERLPRIEEVLEGTRSAFRPRAQRRDPGDQRGAARPPSATRPASQHPLRDAGPVAAAPLPLLRQRPGLVTRDYGYAVENQIRERFGLERRSGVDRLRTALS